LNKNARMKSDNDLISASLKSGAPYGAGWIRLRRRVV
jgi:hypothetical protein